MVGTESKLVANISNQIHFNANPAADEADTTASRLLMLVVFAE